MSIDDLKLRTKVLLPLALMALVLAGVTGFGAVQLRAV